MELTIISLAIFIFTYANFQELPTVFHDKF